MELRDLDVNEPAEVEESSTPEPENVETHVEPAKEPEHVEEPTNEPAEVPAKAQEETPAPESEEHQQPKRSRAADRIQEVLRENKELKEKMENFSQQVAPELQKEEIAYDDLNKVINQRAMQAAELLVASKQVESKMKEQAQVWQDDLEQSVKDNPQLDPKSPEYDPELNLTLARLLDDGNGMPRTDILVSDVLKTFQKRESQVVAKAQEEGKNDATVKIAKQIAESAITPTAKAPSDAQEYSDEELSELRTKNPKEYMRIIDKI